MADNTDLLNQIRQVVREENEPIKRQLDEQGKKLDNQSKKLDDHGRKLDLFLDSQEHTMTVLETLDEKIEATKKEVDEIKKS